MDGEDTDSGPGMPALESSRLPPFQQLVLTTTGVSNIKLEDVSTLTTFEACRAVFKKALAHLQKALDVFVLDGFVSDHCAQLALIGKLYKHVSHTFVHFTACSSHTAGPFTSHSWRTGRLTRSVV